MNALPRKTILVGDARQRLAELLAESVDCVITSPPYFRLRDYQVAGQLGQEDSIDTWVGELRGVFREIARVLKPHGSVWLNVGDGYSRARHFGAPAKSILAGPERLLLGLLADGWICRNKVIWAKQNPLPQSAPDRLSPTYEVVYLLVRRPTYYFDLDAIRVPHRSGARNRTSAPTARTEANSGLAKLRAAGRVGHVRGKNPGDVWWLPKGNYRGEHFATFPHTLIERPLLATCPERICVQCDRAWRRPVRILTVHTSEGGRTIRRVGDLSRCDCFAPTRPGVDPFFGTGTVGEVAARHGRDFLGIELNPTYVALARKRLEAARRRAA